MMRLHESVGRAVVARDTAETIGSLDGAVVDVPSCRIVALQVGKGRKARLADWSAVSGVGPDAVVVESEASLREPRHEREQGFVKGDLPLLGGRVLTDRGDVAGALDDLEFDEGTGVLTALVAGGQSIPASRLRSIGPYALVVAAVEGDTTAAAPG